VLPQSLEAREAFVGIAAKQLRAGSREVRHRSATPWGDGNGKGPPARLLIAVQAAPPGVAKTSVRYRPLGRRLADCRGARMSPLLESMDGHAKPVGRAKAIPARPDLRRVPPALLQGQDGSCDPHRLNLSADGRINWSPQAACRRVRLSESTSPPRLGDNAGTERQSWCDPQFEPDAARFRCVRS